MEPQQNDLLTELVTSFPLPVVSGQVAMSYGRSVPLSSDKAGLQQYADECLSTGVVPFWPVRWRYSPSNGIFFPTQVSHRMNFVSFPNGTPLEMKRRVLEAFADGGKPQEVVYLFEGNERASDSGFNFFRDQELEKVISRGYNINSGKFILAIDRIDHSGEEGSGSIEDSVLTFAMKEQTKVKLSVGSKLSSADKFILAPWYERMQGKYGNESF